MTAILRCAAGRNHRGSIKVARSVANAYLEKVSSTSVTLLTDAISFQGGEVQLFVTRTLRQHSSPVTSTGEMLHASL